PFADVFRYDIAPQRNDGGMPDDIIVENGNIGGAASDIDQYHARFLLLRTKNRFRRRKGLQDQILGFQTGLGNAFVDVADGVHLPGNDVKVRFQPNPRHTDRIGDSRFIIHGEFLRQYINDLLAGRHHQALHILDEAIDIRLADLRIGIVPGKNTAVLETADVLPGDPHVHDADIHIRFISRNLGSLQNTRYGFIDICYHPAHYPGRLGFSYAQNFKLSCFGPATDNYANFRSSDIQSDNYFRFFHAV